jgi:hypothetical protein
VHHSLSRPKLTFEVKLGVGHCGGEVDAAFVLFAEVDGRRRLVEPDAKALQLLFDKPLVRHRLEAVQHDEDEIARARCADDLHHTIPISQPRQPGRYPLIRLAKPAGCSILDSLYRVPHLSATALAVLGTLDDTGQVQQLDLRALVSDHARDTRQRRELIACAAAYGRIQPGVRFNLMKYARHNSGLTSEQLAHALVA